MLNTLEQDVIIICLLFGIHSIFKYLFVCVSLNVVFIAWKWYKRAISTLKKKIKEDWLYEKTELNLESQILMTNKISRHSTARQNFRYQNGPLNKKFGQSLLYDVGFSFYWKDRFRHDCEVHQLPREVFCKIWSYFHSLVPSLSLKLQIGVLFSSIPV